MFVLIVTGSANVLRNAQSLQMFLYGRRLYMQACRAVASLALNILHMGCLFYAYETTGFTISCGVTRKTLGIMILTSHFQYAEVS